MAERLTAAAAATLRASAVAAAPSTRRGARAPNRAFFPNSSASPAPARAGLRAEPSRLPQKARTVRCAPGAAAAASDVAQLKAAREDIRELLRTTHCHPILVRLGWHDSGTYDKNIEEWPQRGGANGSLRFDVELKHGANADAGPSSPADHLREVFYRMGLDDKEIVALSGAHTLGRSRPERSGWGKPETKYTKNGPGAPGGQSWTAEWLKFDNSYFKEIKEKRDQDLLVLPTDAALFEDPGFKAYAEKYAVDQDAFFKDYAVAHAKLSNLGAKFNPPQATSFFQQNHC
ncbi:putative L-ascorbate peroxidase 8, chloroplastic [Dichanthelium oligosanthes]|uniref:Putative L-ascorbate peroxidase 8, chloroplastic n=1 Tax=Dichanthelium oligosanthes TaxID=888268 RepID=A0A1E5VKB7_9POAL|nr:putative L-ascorbate peroxidase 8, chloroplastic [Dichanthelium oligosanthes]